MNVLTVTGRLTADPVRRDTDKGVVCDFGMSVDGQRRLWLPVTCRGRLAFTCRKYLRAGSRVEVSGQLRVTEYVAGGETRRRWYVRGEHVTVLGGPKDARPADERPCDPASHDGPQVGLEEGA